MPRKITHCLLLLTGLLGACAPPSMYDWGDYETRLYAYYKDPEALDALMKGLDSAITRGEKDKRVPPGLYAEYGFLLMVKEQRDEAITYFNKEKSTWPESTVLMDKMISAANSS
jgi:hypothetical protein